MKKSLLFISLLILLVVAFVGGARFSQRGTSRAPVDAKDRTVLHYVDPMNPEHITKEPGIAPCGMPMEPVYAEDVGGAGTTGAVRSATPGAVTINAQKQQIIGVRIGEVARSQQTHHLRALGRIIPDENRVYSLISATDGWLEEISESTTGSMVNEHQLLAQIKVYNYDFFTWQQRYLTELGYTSRISAAASPLTTVDQGRRRTNSGDGYQAGLPIPESDIRMLKRAEVIAKKNAAALAQEGTEALGAPEAVMEATGSSDQTEPGVPNPTMGGKPAKPAKPQMAKPGESHSAHTEHMSSAVGAESNPNRDPNLLYASKGRQELLNFGVEESQLQALAENGSYITHVDLRAPVNGYVLTRNVSPLQKVDRGTECFKIADLSRVWVEADIYANEAGLLQPGTPATISLPGQTHALAATVSAIQPRFDAQSRTLKVRLEVDNPAYELRPEMFVDVEFLIPLAESITVPSSAVINSGKRQLVYVLVEDGVFEPRPVVTGWQTGSQVEVVKGLQPGEKIVVSGNFLIDSESRMKLAATKLMEDQAEPSSDTPAPVASAAPEPQLALPELPEKIIVPEGKDLVCGMTVDPEQAQAEGLIVEADGKTYYFCSADCKEQFQQDPHRFLAEKTDDQKQTVAPGHGGHPHD